MDIKDYDQICYILLVLDTYLYIIYLISFILFKLNMFLKNGHKMVTFINLC